MLIYKAGCMTYLNDIKKWDKAIKWRVDLKNKIDELNSKKCSDIKIFDPTLNYDNNLKYNSKTIVAQNNYYLNKCDIVVANLDYLNHSAGTIYEIFYAHLHNKPVIAFGEDSYYNQPHIHESIDIKVNSLDEVMNYIENLYIQ